jgi:hypothetical protein
MERRAELSRLRHDFSVHLDGLASHRGKAVSFLSDLLSERISSTLDFHLIREYTFSIHLSDWQPLPYLGGAVMRQNLLILSVGFMCLFAPGWTSASTGDLGSIIEGFVTRHFPDATSHIWVMNSTQWDGDEMIVDVQTYVVEKQQPTTIENRYLLLIIAGKLTAAQQIPLDKEPECQSEET